MLVLLLYPLIAVVPSAIYLHLIRRLNKAGKNSRGLIAGLIAMSAAGMIASMVLHNRLTEGALDQSALPEDGFVYAAILYLLIVPMLEEGIKFSVLFVGTWRHSSFTHSYDGVILGVCAAFGFAVLENFIYMASFGLVAGLARAVFPIHIVCGIFMGHYYMLAKESSIRNRNSQARSYLAISLLLPMGLHGFFNFSLSYDASAMIYLFLLFVVILAVATVKSTRRYARENELLPRSARETWLSLREQE